MSRVTHPLGDEIYGVLSRVTRAFGDKVKTFFSGSEKPHKIPKNLQNTYFCFLSPQQVLRVKNDATETVIETALTEGNLN